MLQYIAEQSANTFTKFLFTTKCHIQTQTKLKYANPRGRASSEGRGYETVVTEYGVVETLGRRRLGKVTRCNLAKLAIFIIGFLLI